MNISEILRLKFPDANFMNQIVLQDDGQGVYIKKWDYPGHPEIPTEEELKQWEQEMIPVKAELEVIQNRREEYPPIGDQLDALLKYFEHKRSNGEDLMPDPDLDNVIDQWRAVKTKYPKTGQ